MTWIRVRQQYRNDFGYLHYRKKTANNACNPKLTLPQLGQILGRLRFRAQPIELLTLSACDTTWKVSCNPLNLRKQFAEGFFRDVFVSH